MGEKVINWIVAKMPELVDWVGGMSETGVLVLGIGLMVALVLSWELMRYAVGATPSVGRADSSLREGAMRGRRWDEEEYEDWMDAEIWAEGR